MSHLTQAKVFGHYKSKPYNPHNMIADGIPLEDTDSHRLAPPDGIMPLLAIKPENPNCDKGKTGEIEVPTGYFSAFITKTYFKKSTYDDLIIECDEDLGDIQLVSAGMHFPAPMLVKFMNSIGWHDYWFINYFEVAYYRKHRTEAISNFPCYRWIGASLNQVTVASRTATLQQLVAKNQSVLIEQRDSLLKERRKLYEWGKFHNGVPSGMDDSVSTLPLDEQFERAKTVNFYGNIFKGEFSCNLRASFRMIKLGEILNKISIGDDPVKNLYDFEYIVEGLAAWEKNPEDEVPVDPIIPCYKGYRWVSDVEFGRQILNGVDPVVIRKCTEIPSNFAVTDDMVKHLLCIGKTLKEEMENGHVYICDLSEILHDLPTRKGYYCAAPFCLLYVNAAKQLIPIAIQLRKDPGPNNPVFLPTDSWFEWLLAKMFYRAADSQFHQVSTHYISCHASMEAYGVATMRNIPDSHPLYKLLQPHFRYTMCINREARAKLINQDGVIAQYFAMGSDGIMELLKRAATAHRVHWTNIKRNLKERGVDNPNELPGYYFRDDGVKIWDAIEDYVRDIIDIYYTNDDDVKNDTEVQQWAQEVHSEAFPGFHGAPRGHGFPDNMSSKAELIEYCTLIIFTGSAQHAAVNFGQFNTYGYTPNAPVGMRKPPPQRSHVAYHNGDLMAYLPDSHTAAMAASITFALSQFSPDEIFLGKYPKHWFTEEAACQAQGKLARRLEDLDQEIVKRNEKLDDHYIHLRPTRIPNSITI